MLMWKEHAHRAGAEMTVSTTVTHGGVTYQTTVAPIKKTFLGREEHGFLTFHLECESDTVWARVGGITLDSAPDTPGGNRVPSQRGMAMVAEVISTAGVTSWEELPGTVIAVIYDEDRAVGFANPINGAVLVFDDFLKSLRKAGF